MRRPIWPIVFALALLFASLTHGRKTSPEVAVRESEEYAANVVAKGAAAAEHRHDEPEPGVSDAVHEALEILKTLQGTGAGYAKRTKPSGVFENSLHYAKITFRFLFMNGPSEEKSKKPRLGPQLSQAVSLLEPAAAEQDPDALFLLGEMNLYGNFTHPKNYYTAFDYYDTLASLTGNATAQHIVGFMFATGLGGVERDQARALLYHTFAADQGDTRSQMTVGFRHHSGIGAPRNCDKAAHYYKQVADKVIAYWKAGPPGGRQLSMDAFQWADEQGGLYGEGASASSAGSNAHREHSTLEDIMEYLDMESRVGDLKATFSLGKLNYEGSRLMKPNFRRAHRHFNKVARAYWGKDGQPNPNPPPGIDKIAGKSAAHIGRIFLRGEGVEPSYAKALTWFKRGIQTGDALCQYHMGLMYLDGLGVPQDAIKAASFLKVAADQDLANAQSVLGTLFLDQGDVDVAVLYFELAARNGRMEAFYYLAELANKGIGRDERNCGVATAYYKIVAERAESLHSSFAEANAAYDSGDTETALVLSMMAAEQGYENAQVNVAYLLDSQQSALDLWATINPFAQKKSSSSSLTRIKPLALIYFTRSAKQSNVDSLLKAGDYYLAGTGVPDSVPDLEAASTCYHSAAERQNSAQAFWNLGWMHENGLTVSQDFHMAKRYYDLALETNSEAYLPVKLALGRLRLRSWWNSITGGSVNSIQAEPDDSDSKPRRTLGEWMKHFWENAEEQAAAQNGAMEGDDLDLDTGAATGSSGAGPHDQMPGGDGEYYEDFDDGIIESLIIIGLAATLALLVFWRQQRQLQGQRRLRDQQQQAQGPARNNGLPDPIQNQQPPNPAGGVAAGDHGFFPEPGQPEFGQWVAGGVGH